MSENPINQRRIRDSAPYRKSITLTELDLQRAAELERTFNTQYPLDAPFNFSQTISKAIEIAFIQIITPIHQPFQQSLTGLPVDPEVLQARQEQKSQPGLQPGPERKVSTGKPKKFQKTKRGF
jgi:hypothetical protein